MLLVTFAISGVVVVFYVYVMPIVLKYDNMLFIICHLICGHWLLLNIAFHYYKAVTSSPGYPPSVSTGAKLNHDSIDPYSMVYL